ncbi:MAG: Single-stranded-DNA-specific exonuclease RecJ, partial [Parcubacteria group bacterium GW2011_GWC2_45_15]
IVLSKTKNIGLQKLIEVSGLSPDRLDNYAIGWQLAPRINAAGRMEHANAAYKLLTTKNIEEAITIAHSLNKSNQERQVLTERLINESIAQLGEIDERLPVLFVQGQDWPIGIIGLVASKLTNKFARPAIVLSGGADELVASGRSIVEFNLIEALDEFKSYLVRYGGHSAAAGFTIKAAEFFEFKEKFIGFAQNKLAGVQFLPRIYVDAEVKLEQINWRLVEALADFEPFGQGNHKPKFLISGLTLMSVETVGLESKHLRLMVQEGSLQRKVICFGFGEANDLLAPGGKVDLVCEAGVNEWNGKKELQLSLVDYRKIV